MAQELKKPFISFGKRLFFSVMLLYLFFSSAFLAYQYQREKAFRTEILNTRLQDYNNRLDEELALKKPEISLNEFLANYINRHRIDSLRITLIDTTGKVVFDNIRANLSDVSNHLKRTEVEEALHTGKGQDIQRASVTTGIEYFYSANYYGGEYIIRTALPYNVSLLTSLKVDSGFIWFTLIATLILTILFYRYTQLLGASVSRLYEFTQQAERDEPIDINTDFSFPDTELGEISQHIIRIYQHLHETKEELYIEREKLITHLQSSREGLGIFTADGKEILVNSLFTQYANLISDSTFTKTEEIFSIPELKEISNFIRKSKSAKLRWGEKRMRIGLDKSGKSFEVECIIFQDHSFEISITDISHEKEQNDIKRQLTQNAAHELKTPVSSIQGYLETIVSNPNLSKEKMDIFLERCYAQSNRLSRLLRDISVLTRMDEAPTMFDMEKVDISHLLKNIFNEVALELEEKNIKVINEIDDNTGIRGNSSLVYSIFRNLTDNAIAYAGTGICITIKCFREDENFYYFSFADNGVGISEEHLNRLFERFYRVDKGRSRKMGGTGLGLAIVKNAVVIHGGNISAKNNQGGGLEFIFTLAKGHN